MLERRQLLQAHITEVVARPFPDDTAVRYVLPVMWTTSRLHIKATGVWCMLTVTH